MLDFIKNDSVFYIVAPANMATGGPELLHQLAYKLKQSGKSVKMFYVPAEHENPVHKNYLEYNIELANRVEEIESNVLITPETQTLMLSNYTKLRKIIWWLSVDNYFFCLPNLKGGINRALLNYFGVQRYLFFKKNINLADHHLVQSDYAKQLLESKGIQKISHLSDYLHKSFLSVQTERAGKRNIVAYNPKKGIKFTKRLMKNAPNIEFLPIENMSRQEVVSLLQKSKVYIDFGFHPGKDRIPREAAILQCCVITNRRGSAGNNQDLPIPEEFKFSEESYLIPDVVAKIEDCFVNFEKNNSKFDAFRAEIIDQESEFENQIRQIFLAN